MQLPMEERKRRMNSFPDDDDFIQHNLSMKRMPIVFYCEEWDDEESFPDIDMRDNAHSGWIPFWTNTSRSEFFY